MSEHTPRVMIIGLGPIGLSCARAIRAEAGIKLVALVDSNTQKAGMTIEQFTGKPDTGDEDGRALRILNDIDDVTEPVDIAVLAITSRLEVAAPMIRRLIQKGCHVISSCEELVWPWYHHESLATQLNTLAAQHGVTVLGTGVNPGFVLDMLPVTLASMVRRVSRVRGVRRVDSGLRRASLLTKLGTTQTIETFEKLKAADEIGHIGLCESVAMLASGLGRRVAPGSIIHTLEPVIAQQPTPSALGLIAQGRVAGTRNTATWEDQGLRIELDLTMAVGLENTGDRIEIYGPVAITAKIPGAMPGDSATVAAILNAIGNSHKWTPGLKTMLDVPPSGCHNRDWQSD